jgi:iron complex transport system permease protein
MSFLRPAILMALLGVISLAVILLSLRTGAVPITWFEMLGAPDSIGTRVFQNMRLPRTLAGFLCGGALGICGAALQGLFRNPLADPALVGVSGGAATGAVAGIVFAGGIPGFGFWLLPACAFAGALAAVVIVHRIAESHGRVLVPSLLLAGIGVNAMSGAAIGWMVFNANDSQLRDFTFWSLGSVAGVGWNSLLAMAPPILVSVALLLRHAGTLNALSLGESDAWHLGAPVNQVKRSILISTALAVGAGTAFTGTIGFIGLVAPHLVRMLAGACHRMVLPASFLAGGCLLTGADVVARIAKAPADIPVGIVVASIGAPFLILLLLRGRRYGL